MRHLNLHLLFGILVCLGMTDTVHSLPIAKPSGTTMRAMGSCLPGRNVDFLTPCLLRRWDLESVNWGNPVCGCTDEKDDLRCIFTIRIPNQFSSFTKNTSWDAFPVQLGQARAVYSEIKSLLLMMDTFPGLKGFLLEPIANDFAVYHCASIEIAFGMRDEAKVRLHELLSSSWQPGRTAAGFALAFLHVKEGDWDACVFRLKQLADDQISFYFRGNLEALRHLCGLGSSDNQKSHPMRQVMTNSCWHGLMDMAYVEEDFQMRYCRGKKTRAQMAEFRGNRSSLSKRIILLKILEHGVNGFVATSFRTCIQHIDEGLG